MRNGIFVFGLIFVTGCISHDDLPGPMIQPQLFGIGSKCDLGEFGSFEIFKREYRMISKNEEEAGVWYTPPKNLTHLPRFIIDQRIRVSVREQSYGEWKLTAIGYGDGPNHRSSQWLKSLVQDWRKTFYFHVEIMEKGGKWNESPEIEVNLENVKSDGK